MEKIKNSDNMSKDIRKAMRVSLVSVAINLLLSLFKLLAGIIGHSQAMISDALHSASDVLSTFIVMIGINISGKKSDKEHPFGHERMECVASIILAVILAVIGVSIGINGMKIIISGNYGELIMPGKIAMFAALLSIVVKEGMYWYTRNAAKQINSGALMADAWHHRSDAFSSVGALIGIFGARMGYPILDPIASVIICLFIAKAAYDIFVDAINKMVDKSCDEQCLEKMTETVKQVAGVRNIDSLRTRMFGAKIYVELEISADENIPLKDAHLIADHVHDAIEMNFGLVKHCMVHVNPYKNSET